MLRKIGFIQDNHAEKYGDKEYFLPDGWGFFDDICYVDDGSPVVFKRGESLGIRIERPITAIDYLKGWPREWLPKSLEHGIRPPSNSELFRWLRDGAIIINGQTPKPYEEITFPITELVFFPKGKRRTTLVLADEVIERRKKERQKSESG